MGVWTKGGKKRPVTDRNPLTSTYTGALPGVMRSAEELWLRLQGRRVDWSRVEMTDKQRADMERLLKSALEVAAK